MGRWYEALKNSSREQRDDLQNHRNTLPSSFEGFEGASDSIVVKILSNQLPDEKRMLFEERAAILEFEEGLDRLEAEAIARREVYGHA